MKVKKRKILVFIDWFYPAHKAGGPIKSVFNLITLLDKYVDFYVVTSAYDFGEKSPMPNIVTNEWLKCANYSVIYLEVKNQTKKRYQQILMEIMPNMIYLNSMFSIGFALKPILANGMNVRTVLAPRGMLKKDALAIKPVKKKLFLFFMRFTGFMKSIVWHASSGIEADEINLHFGSSAEVLVAQNVAIPVPKRPRASLSKFPGRLHLIFFSRINRIKNLDFLLEVLNEINDDRVILDIFGPLEDKAYWENCQSYIAKYRLNVNYKGILNHLGKEEVLWQYDYMILPTKGENFGHVIAESLLASLPVIVSQNTPWRGLEKTNSGFDLPLVKQSFKLCLKELLKQDNKTYSKFSEGAFRFSNEKLFGEEVLSAHKKLFLR